MELRLEQVLPHPLKDRDIQHSEVWLRNVELRQGERVQVNAPSGTGKTTLGLILYGLRNDFEGSAYWDGKRIESLSINEWSELRQRHLSFIFQDLRLFDEYTGLENILIKSRLTDIVSEAEIGIMAEELGVAFLLNKKTAKMSRGEMQRIAIIRALVQPFDWIIMDEPFSHLDHKNAERAAALIDRKCKENNAGLILLELEEDHHFEYDKKLIL